MGMDHYNVIKQLGGTTGTSLAIDKQDGSKKVVIKRLLDGSKGMEELNVSLRLRHPNIIPFLESFVHEGVLYAVLLYAEGGDLEAYLADLAKKRVLPSATQLLKWFKQLMTALEHCHKEKIMHRDVKPGNIFLNSSASELYLGDFGSAKAFLRNISTTSTFVGSPIWISPELLSGTAYSYPSDVWSLGCVFYEMAALRRPFTSASFALLVQQITSGKIAPLPPTVPEDIRTIIMSMLEVDPQRRISLLEALEKVERAMESREASGEEPRGAVEKGPPPMYLPKRALDARARSRSIDLLVPPQPPPPLPSDDEARLSMWVHARKHDVGIIERYLNKFRQADDEALEAPSETPIQIAIPEKFQGQPQPHRFSRQVSAASPPKRSSQGSPKKLQERASPPKQSKEASPSQQQQQIIVVAPVRVRPHAPECEVRVESPKKHALPNRKCRRGVVLAQKPKPQQQQQRAQGARKGDNNTSGSSCHSVAPRAPSPLARLPSNSHHLIATRVKNAQSGGRQLSPLVVDPQQERERSQLREKRNQQRAKMMEMIREQKAKALLERKAGGKSKARNNALPVEILLPDNVRYVNSV